VFPRRPQAGEGATGLINDDAADDRERRGKHEILNLKFERKRKMGNHGYREPLPLVIRI
jgi:hypothetical protein